MINEEKDKIDEMLIVAYKILFKRIGIQPPRADWQRIADIINARFSYPFQGQGGTYDYWKANNHHNRLLFTDKFNEWGNLPLESEKVQNAISSYNLALF